MIFRRSILYALISVSLVALSLVSATADPQTSSSELPLGKPGLKESRTTEQITPGVTYMRIVRGQQSNKDFYTVDVAFKADRAAAEEVAARLRSDGYDPVIVEVAER